MGSISLPGPALVRLRCVSQMQHPLPKPVGDSVDGLQQTIVDFTLLGLIEEVGLHRLGLSLLPVTYPDPDEPHRLARQVAVKKKCPGFPQDCPFVVSRNGEFVLAGMGFETCEADLQRHHGTGKLFSARRRSDFGGQLLQGITQNLLLPDILLEGGLL